jgi:hypothetical protein
MLLAPLAPLIREHNTVTRLPQHVFAHDQALPQGHNVSDSQQHRVPETMSFAQTEECNEMEESKKLRIPRDGHNWGGRATSPFH